MTNTRRALLCSTFVLSTVCLFACGAGTGGKVVRPDDKTAAEALGGGKCSNVADEPQLLTLDWEDSQRIELEVAMQKHVAVVHYDCSGFKVLRDCEIDGTYEYAGVSPAKTNAKLNDQDELQANLPLGAATMSGAIKRGSTIDLVYIAVGQQSTTVNDVQRDKLKGKCDGATHTVRNANLGAFAVATGTHGEVNAAVALLGKSASGSSESSKDVNRVNGELEACNAASDSAKEPTPKCKAIVQLLLSPIAGGAGEVQASRLDSKIGGGKVDEHTSLSTKPLRNPCTAGFRLAKENVCTRADKATAYLCDAAALDECKAQCEKGDPRSCYNAAANRLDSKMNPDANKTGRAEAIGYLEKSCTIGYAAGCADLGNAVMYGNGTERNPDRGQSLLMKACSMGDALACGYLASASKWGSNSVKKDQGASRKYYERACSLGSDNSCLEASHMYTDGIGGPKDPDLAAKLLTRSCAGGNEDNCKRGLTIANNEASLANEGEAVKLKEGRRGSSSSIEPITSPCRSTLRVDDQSMTCVKPASTPSMLCDITNFDECKAQCDKGNARSCWNAAANRVGQWNQNSGSTGREEALPYLEKACQAGYAPGCGQFAEAVFYGNGTASNKDRGKTLIAKACDMKEPASCTFLAYAMRNGGNTYTKDTNKALEFYEKACSYGATQACADGASMLTNNSSNAKDVPKGGNARAIKMLDIGCKAGDNYQCTRMSNLQAPSATASNGKKPKK